MFGAVYGVELPHTPIILIMVMEPPQPEALATHPWTTLQ